MTAPVATTRQSPSGVKLDDGFSTKVTFGRKPNVALWEKTVKPAGIDGGDKVDTTTMHNTRWRTSSPRKLLTLTDGSFKCAYDPAVLSDLVEMVNQPDTITITFPDGSTDAFFGYMKSFEPDEVQEGQQPEATVNFVPTNYDHDSFEEAGPTVVEVAGT